MTGKVTIPGLVSCSFYAIPISPHLICKFFFLLVSFLFLLLLAIAIVHLNVQTGIKLLTQTSKLVAW